MRSEKYVSLNVIIPMYFALQNLFNNNLLFLFDAFRITNSCEKYEIKVENNETVIENYRCKYLKHRIKEKKYIGNNTRY